MSALCGSVYHMSPTPTTPDGWLALRTLAETFADTQEYRISIQNRFRSGTVDPDLTKLRLDDVERHEKAIRGDLISAYRATAPDGVREWVKDSKGLGEPLMARILGHLGHPRIATPYHWEGVGTKRVLVADDPFERAVGQLWSYCGHGRPGRRVRGMSAEEAMGLGSPHLKKLVFLSASFAMRQEGYPYREVYVAGRERYENRVHAVPCAPCGKVGKPAVEGVPWKKGHQHAAALRLTGKEILRDMWKVAA